MNTAAAVVMAAAARAAVGLAAVEALGLELAPILVPAVEPGQLMVEDFGLAAEQELERPLLLTVRDL